MKKSLALLAGVLFSGVAAADPILCLDSAGNCSIDGYEPAAMKAIHMANQGDDVTSAVGIPQGEPDASLYEIHFSSTQTFDHAAGFAQIRGDGGNGPLTNLSFNVHDLVLPNDSIGLEVVEFDILSTGNLPGIVDFSAEFSDGSSPVNPFGNAVVFGQQTVTIWTDSLLESITIDSVEGFEIVSFRHLRVDADLVPDGGPDPQQVDAPANLALLSLGLIGLYAQRKFKSA